MFPMHFWIREFVTGKEQHKRWQKKYLDFLKNDCIILVVSVKIGVTKERRYSDDEVLFFICLFICVFSFQSCTGGASKYKF